MTMRNDVNKLSNEVTTMNEDMAESQIRDNCKHPTWVTIRVL